MNGLRASWVDEHGERSQESVEGYGKGGESARGITARWQRQAAPFSKDKPKRDPKKPGRKPGSKYGRQGRIPVADRPRLRARSSARASEGSIDLYRSDIPPIETWFDHGHCQECGRRVRHPLLSFEPRSRWDGAFRAHCCVQKMICGVVRQDPPGIRRCWVSPWRDCVVMHRDALVEAVPSPVVIRQTGAGRSSGLAVFTNLTVYEPGVSSRPPRCWGKTTRDPRGRRLGPLPLLP